jgi:putative methyltransferase
MLHFHLVSVPPECIRLLELSSIHPEENEHVVREALKCDEALQAHFHLAPRSQVIPTWERRGKPEEMYDPGTLHPLPSMPMPKHNYALASELIPLSSLISVADAESLIRTMPGDDRTNGFFVAVFVRDGPTSSSDNSLKRKLDDGEAGDSANGKKPKKKRKKKTKKFKSIAASTTVDQESDLEAQ